MNNIETTFQIMKTTVEMMEQIGPEGRKMLDEVYHRNFSDGEPRRDAKNELSEMIHTASCGELEMLRQLHLIASFDDFIESQNRFEIFYSGRLKANILVEFATGTFTAVESADELFRFLVGEIGSPDKVR